MARKATAARQAEPDPSVFEQLEEVCQEHGKNFNLQGPTEPDEVYAKRMVAVLAKMPEDAWNELPDDVQEWFNAAADQVNANKKPTMPDGFVSAFKGSKGSKRAAAPVDDDPPEEDDAPEDSDEEEPPEEDDAPPEDDDPNEEDSDDSSDDEEAEEDEPEPQPAARSRSAGAKALAERNQRREREQKSAKSRTAANSTSSRRTARAEPDEDDEPAPAPSRRRAAAPVEDDDEPTPRRRAANGTASKPSSKPTTKPAREAASGGPSMVSLMRRYVIKRHNKTVSVDELLEHAQAKGFEPSRTTVSGTLTFTKSCISDIKDMGLWRD